jgi:hypothetical protein
LTTRKASPVCEYDARQTWRAEGRGRRRKLQGNGKEIRRRRNTTNITTK